MGNSSGGVKGEYFFHPLLCLLHSRPAIPSSSGADVFRLRWSPAKDGRIERRYGFFVPEGHRRKLAGGKAAPADAAPG